jgi:hypothetical protein
MVPPLLQGGSSSRPSCSIATEIALFFCSFTRTPFLLSFLLPETVSLFSVSAVDVPDVKQSSCWQHWWSNRFRMSGGVSDREDERGVVLFWSQSMDDCCLQEMMTNNDIITNNNNDGNWNAEGNVNNSENNQYV